MEFKNFATYTPDIPPVNDSSSETEMEQAAHITNLLEKGVAFAKSECGSDWYESQSQFASDTLKIVYDSNGIIRASSNDVSQLWPATFSVAEVDASAVPEGFKADGNWVYAEGAISARVATSAELIAAAEKTRTSLITTARSTINEWQTELALGTIEDDEKAQLVEWLAYIKAVKAVDTSTAPDITWPDAPASTN